MKSILFFSILSLWGTIVPLKSQTYSTTDVNALLALDAVCDLMHQLNWNTEPNKANWTGVYWNSQNPQRVMYLMIGNKSLTGNIDVSPLASLIQFNCENNHLNSVNASGIPALTYFICYNSRLTSLNATGSVNLLEMDCYDNKLTSLNLTGLTNLSRLYCGNNLLTSLDVSGLTKLSHYSCGSNSLPFSSLATALNFSLFTFQFNPQDTIFPPQSFAENTTINYSSEAVFKGTLTNFRFYRDNVEVATNSTGIFTTTGSGVYNCKMTNSKFTGLTLTTANVTITGGTTAVKKVETKKISISQNPESGIIKVDVPQELLPAKISIYNIAGKQIFEQLIIASATEFNTGIWQPGVYIVKVNSGRERVSLKILNQ